MLELKEIYRLKKGRKKNDVKMVCIVTKTYFLIRNIAYDTEELEKHITQMYPENVTKHYIANVVESEDQTRHVTIIHSTWHYLTIKYANVKTSNPLYDYMDKGHYFITRGQNDQYYHFFDFDPSSIHNIEHYLPGVPPDAEGRFFFHAKTGIMKAVKKSERQEARRTEKNRRRDHNRTRYLQQYIREQKRRFVSTKNGIMYGKYNFSVRCKQKVVNIPTLREAITSIADDKSLETRRDIRKKKNQTSLKDVFKKVAEPIRDEITNWWGSHDEIDACIIYNDKKLTIKKRVVRKDGRRKKTIWLNKKRISAYKARDIIDVIPTTKKSDVHRLIAGEDLVSRHRKLIESGINICVDNIKIMMPLAYKNKTAVIRLGNKDIPLKCGIGSAEIINNCSSFDNSEDPRLLKVLCKHIKNTEDIVSLSKYFLERMEAVYKKAAQLLKDMKNITPTTQTMDSEQMNGYLVYGKISTYFINKETAKVWTYPSGRYICIADATSEPVCIIDRVVSRILALRNDSEMLDKISTLAPKL